MNWDRAYQLVIDNIIKGTKLNASYRTVLETPPYRCGRHDYVGEGFKVRIGKTTTIEIPQSMLMNIFEESVKNNHVYNGKIFRSLYPKQGESKTGHPCHIHVVGRIFEIAGVAEKIDNHNYRIL
jgi:hypothetical protein